MLVGIDVGSTTVKAAVVDRITKKVKWSDYKRHNAEQAKTVQTMLADIHAAFPGEKMLVAVCGSGGQSVANAIGAFFIQEVVANSIVIREFHSDVRVAIELGGQDAKVIFFRYDETTDSLVTSDMRMNGSCAGGTGAFIDQIAELLSIKPEEFGALAAKGTIVYDISGRCGVFAKTDIQPLLNQGVAKEDIALSTFHAIAKQTIGGLAQGMDITPKVIFEGGPLTFNPRLIDVFIERLNLSEKDVIIPDQAEIMVAHGAALSIPIMFADKECSYNEADAKAGLLNLIANPSQAEEAGLLAGPFFKTDEERESFHERFPSESFVEKEYEPGTTVNAYLGLDAGSTTSKFVLIDENEEVIYKFYSNNHGDPLKVVKHALIQMKRSYEQKGITLNIIGCGSTGYGELLFAKAFHCDYHTVETVAHAEAAQKYAPDVSFILDIGGQDMKAIFIKEGIVNDIVLNEACSAGCGSFIETYARSLGVPVNEIAELAFNSKSPSVLGSRCTVFMNSSIITEQKNGKSTQDILAGISKSIIENVFTKVVRVSNIAQLGSTIVVQGGTFKNDAVLRSIEQYTELNIVRPPFPGEMGAVGIALLTKKQIETEKEQSVFNRTFIGIDAMEGFDYKKEPGNICTFCANNCNRTVVTFNDGSTYITGNRCERGEVLGDAKDKSILDRIKQINKKMTSVPDTMTLHSKLLTKDYPIKNLHAERELTIGIPRTLEFWVSLPFWRALFRSLGFKVVVSKKSDYKLFESGLQSVPSDTVCFPAKIAHGHIVDLVKKEVDRIFMPMMIRIPPENEKTVGDCICPVVQGYPMVIDKSDDPKRRHNVPLDHPVFHWYTKGLKHSQIETWLHETLGVDKQEAMMAIHVAEKAAESFRKELEHEGRKILNSLKGTKDFAVVLAGRPYHSDELVNHDIAHHFTRLGIPVISLESFPDLHNEDLTFTRMDNFVPFHVRMMGAAMAVAKNPNLELVQIVSFGCGHDAIISDELKRILSETAGKEPLILKLDEGDVKGPLTIRVKSFVETIRKKRMHRNDQAFFNPLKDGFPAKFLKKDKKEKIIFIPNLSVAFAKLTAKVIGNLGYKVLPMPVADKKAIALGKKHVHNDICFPAQVNIGEILAIIESGKYHPDEIAIGLAKNCDACRAGQYAALARKALDEAGYPQIPIITTGEDTKNMHPGFKLGISFQLNMLWGMALCDGLEMMRRAIKPYEINKGETDVAFEECLEAVSNAVPKSKSRALKELEKAVEVFNTIPVNRTCRKPRVVLVGEILMKYHPGANAYIEDYLEANGMEMVVPGMIDFFRRDPFIRKEKAKRGLHPNPFVTVLTADLEDKIYGHVVGKVDKVLQNFRFIEPKHDLFDIVKHVEGMIDKSFVSGEGWLIPAEIMEGLENGVNSAVIVQPFGCLPNHITGRGMTKAIKEKYPHAQILSLDYDPDTSIANLENRLQMLIITAKELEKERQKETVGAC